MAQFDGGQHRLLSMLMYGAVGIAVVWAISRFF